MLNELPVVITGAGEYRTRDGGRVTIRELSPSPPGTTAFTARGARWTVRRGAYRSRGSDVWHVSGRFLALKPHGHDIMGPLHD